MLKGWRTVIFNGVASIPLFLEAAIHILSIPEVYGVLPPEWIPWYSLAIALANIALRKVTTTPLGKSE